MRFVATAAFAAAAALLITTTSHAADSCAAPCAKLPKNARSVSATAVPLGDFFGMPNVLSATLAKAKKKNILVVEAILTDGPYSPLVLPRVLALGVNVNGLPMQPSPAPDVFEAIEDCGVFRADSDPDGACTVKAEWWLDFDDPANAALLTTPPIVVTVKGGDLSAGPAVGTLINLSVTVRTEKK